MEAGEGPKNIETTKTKAQDQTVAATDLKPKKKAAVVPEISPPAKPKVIRIIIGSYEKVLCGIDAKFDSESTSPNVLSSIDGPDRQNKLVLNPVYMFSAHTGAIKCVAANDRYLVSGGSDEVIKYSHSRNHLTLEYTILKNAKISAH